jgi:hypothetical protein
LAASCNISHGDEGFLSDPREIGLVKYIKGGHHQKEIIVSAKGCCFLGRKS